MNEYEIEDAVRRFAGDDCPNLRHGAETLLRLVRWTNGNSDGWAYWPKPSNAARRLIGLIDAADRFDPVDCTRGELAAALGDIRRFLTRHGSGHDDVFPPPPPAPVIVEWERQRPADPIVFTAQHAGIAATVVLVRKGNDGRLPEYLWAVHGVDKGATAVRLGGFGTGSHICAAEATAAMARITGKPTAGFEMKEAQPA